MQHNYIATDVGLTIFDMRFCLAPGTHCVHAFVNFLYLNHVNILLIVFSSFKLVDTIYSFLKLYKALSPSCIGSSTRSNI